MTVSLVKGYKLYYPPGEGPILNHIYGPFAALVYLPAAIVRTPTNALLIGSLLAATWCLAAAAWLIARSSSASWIARFAAIGSFGCLIHLSDSMNQASSWIHADAPALGLAACAAAILQEGRPRGISSKPPFQKWVVSAIFAAIAIGTKQLVAPIAIVLPIWTATQHGWRAGLKHVAILASSVLIVSAICVVAFGPRGIWVNMFIEPSRHPWHFDAANRFNAFCNVLGLLMKESIPAVLVLIPAALLGTPGDGWRRRWMLPALMAIAMIPTAALGWVKQGGGINNASYVTYFLYIAASSALADCEMLRPIAAYPNPRLAGRALLVMFSIYCASHAYFCDTGLASSVQLAMHPDQCTPEVDYNYELRHPGQAYFPWDALAPLMASGKLYHFDFGVHDRVLAGLVPDEAHMPAYLPPHMKCVVWNNDRYSSAMDQWLAEFDTLSTDTELPGLVVVNRHQPAVVPAKTSTEMQ